MHSLVIHKSATRRKDTTRALQGATNKAQQGTHKGQDARHETNGNETNENEKKRRGSAPRTCYTTYGGWTFCESVDFRLFRTFFNIPPLPSLSLYPLSSSTLRHMVPLSPYSPLSPPSTLPYPPLHPPALVSLPSAFSTGPLSSTLSPSFHRFSLTLRTLRSIALRSASSPAPHLFFPLSLLSLSHPPHLTSFPLSTFPLFFTLSPSDSSPSAKGVYIHTRFA